MRRIIAENQRSMSFATRSANYLDKRVEPFKPHVDRLPISSWAANAAALLSK